MLRNIRRLLPAFNALCFGIAVLCLLLQPIFAAGHELHEAEHALLDDAHVDANTDADVNAGADRPSSLLDHLLHALDCCVHATALPSLALNGLPLQRAAAPQVAIATATIAAPLARAIRPPISA